MISKETAAHVLWHFGRGGYQPGSFTEALLLAFARADTQNRLRLGHAFPNYYEAMSLAQDYEEGIDTLKEILAK